MASDRPALEQAPGTALVGPEAIGAARERLRPVLRPTPAAASDHLSGLLGRPVLLKPEHAQRTGSFKIRGAYNMVSRLPPGVPVVAASAGNHAQGVALAGSLTGHPVTVYMPESVSLPKLEATRGYGAHVELTPGRVADCIAAAARHADREGAVLVPPFDHPDVIAGQGTIGLELVEEAPLAEVVLVPVGGGGLISGVAAALRAAGHTARIVGVQAAGADGVCASRAAGRVVRRDPTETIADGIAIGAPSPLTLSHVLAHVDDVVAVDDEDISRAMLLLLERLKQLVEPAGAASVAPLLAGALPGTGPVACILSGGNVDPLLLTRLIEHGLSAAARFSVVRCVIEDRPGALAALTAMLADMRLNVVAVEHHRAGPVLPMSAVEVALTLETRGREHREEVVERLRGAGYRPRLS